MAEESIRAVVTTAPGPPEVLRIESRPRPEPGPEEVRVRVAASGLNRADLLQRRGRYPVPRGAPEDILGLEYSGVVEAVGERVHRWAEGDRVMGLVSGGGYAEAVVVHEDEAVAIPPGVDTSDGAALPEAFLTAWDAMILQMGLRAGESVLIHAVGSGVGTAAVQLARMAGARVFGTSRSPDKLERALQLGVHEAVEGGDRGWADDVLARTGGRGVDVVVDLVGGAYLAGNLACVAERGRIVVVGVPSGAVAPVDLRALMRRRASLTGTVLRARSAVEKRALVADARDRLFPAFESGSLRPVIHRRFLAEEAAAAHRAMEENANFGTMTLVWGS
jgi:putative PIG3 family NAD(P)H quinone oxidoreductase